MIDCSFRISSYWTPSRCAKILIVVFVIGLPANLYIFKETVWRWWRTVWPYVGTLPKASAAVPPVNTTTSQWLCLQHPSWLLSPLSYNSSSSEQSHHSSQNSQRFNTEQICKNRLLSSYCLITMFIIKLFTLLHYYYIVSYNDEKSVCVSQ